MRLSACIGGLLLAGAGCTGLPGLVRLDVDGRTLELRQKGLSELRGGWSTSPDCGFEPSFDVGEVGASVEGVRVISPDELELTGRDGNVVRVFRCQ